MNIAQIEENVSALLSGITSGEFEQSSFIYELLLAYGHRKQSITRLRSGERNLSAKGSTPRHDEITWKRNLYFKHIDGDELIAEIDQMRKEKRVATYKIRFVIVTNFNQLLAVDTKTSDTLDIQFDELPKQFDFFLPWAGMEKAVYQGENPADVKAAEKMAKLFDLIKDDNFDESNKDDTAALHDLNVFLTRLLFCFFAEDTEIFDDNQFSHAIESHTKGDGSDLSAYLNRLFTVLNTADSKRGDLPSYLGDFPYVNGGLFADDIPSPVFSAKSHRMLIECGSELDWSDINPDIFGSMIQAVVHPDQRGGMGMHYTSVTNIMKVIEPLFLNDLYEELGKVESSATKLQKLQQRLGEIKIFDPACGSGNFLIIAYKELRKLEMEVLKRLQELELEKTGQISQPFSVIKLSHFYGIELDDFAHEVAILSLWLAEHQMNVEFKTEFGESEPALPLNQSGNIVCGNSLYLDWNTVCSTREKEETFVLGNPPYVGSKTQNDEQKEDMKHVFSGMDNFKFLDYVACWFYRASDYTTESVKCAFVATDSISQGLQVEMLWPKIFSKDVEIFFAYQPFKWANFAKGNAGVSCTIIGLRTKSENKKYIFHRDYSHEVKNINSYLVEGNDVIVSKSLKAINNLPAMGNGNPPREGGLLILSTTEKDELIANSPEAKKFIRRLSGSNEFIKGLERWCIWIADKQLEEASAIPFIKDRIDRVRDFRLAGGIIARNCSNIPHRFYMNNMPKTSQIIIPIVSSERREYIPTGYLDSDVVVVNSANTIFDSEPYVLGILNSKIHLAWVKAVAGRLESRIRYAPALCWNTFPFPSISSKKKDVIQRLVFSLLNEREKYNDKTMSDLYDPDKMPDGLRNIHNKLDIEIDSCYQEKPFRNNEERLKVLFRMYEKMTGGKNA